MLNRCTRPDEECSFRWKDGACIWVCPNDCPSEGCEVADSGWGCPYECIFEAVEDGCPYSIDLRRMAKGEKKLDEIMIDDESHRWYGTDGTWKG